MTTPDPRPEAWSAQPTWTHPVVRLPWVPSRLRQHLPAWLRARTCTTVAPAERCPCAMSLVRWGVFPTREEGPCGETE